MVVTNGEFSVIRYEVCETVPEIMGFGFTATREVFTTSEKEAHILLANGRDRLTRLVRDSKGNKIHHYWNNEAKQWEDMDGKPLPY